MSTTFLYFAYGSNMSIRRLQARTPSAIPFCSGEVSGYRLVFDKWSRDGSAKADCEETGNPADIVFGALYHIDERERPALDKAEGAGAGYDPVAVRIKTAGGWVTALSYKATHKVPGLLPYGWYLRHILIGAEEFALSPHYTALLSSSPSQPDTDAVREANELSIYVQT